MIAADPIVVCNCKRLAPRSDYIPCGTQPLGEGAMVDFATCRSCGSSIAVRLWKELPSALLGDLAQVHRTDGLAALAAGDGLRHDVLRHDVLLDQADAIQARADAAYREELADAEYANVAAAAE